LCWVDILGSVEDVGLEGAVFFFGWEREDAVGGRKKTGNGAAAGERSW
jgi:hypothetical protein